MGRLLELVTQLRAAQIAYSRRPTAAGLRRVKRLECRVDAVIVLLTPIHEETAK